MRRPAPLAVESKSIRVHLPCLGPLQKHAPLKGFSRHTFSPQISLPSHNFPFKLIVIMVAGPAVSQSRPLGANVENAGVFACL